MPWIIVNVETGDYFQRWRDGEPVFSTDEKDAKVYTNADKRDLDAALIKKLGRGRLDFPQVSTKKK